MNKDSIIEASLAKLGELLAQHFPADALDFAERAKHAADLLPGELANPLAALVEARARIKADSGAGSEQVADFVFRCGQLYEQIKAYRQIEMEMENVRVGSSSVEAEQLQPGQLDLMARFIETRDRIFRKVADFTLKALLIMLGLLTLGLLLGLI